MNPAVTVRRLAYGAALAAAGYGAVVFFALAYLKMHYPYLINLGEPALSQAVRILSEGRLPYRELSSPPFTLVPYGPVFLSVAAFLKHIFPLPFTGGRLVTLAATVFSSGAIYLILKKGRAGEISSLLGALSFFSVPYVLAWGVLVNVDMTGVFLDLAAFYLWWSWIITGQKTRVYFWAGIFLSVAAFFTKSSMIAAPAAFFWFLIFQKRFKDAAALFLAEAAIAGVIYWSMNRATAGAYFFHTAYEIGHREFFPIFILHFWVDALRQMPLLAAASVAGLWGARRGGKDLFLALYVLFILILTLSLGKQGSDTNYFLPWCAVSCLCAGMALDKIASAEKSWAAPVAAVLILAQLCFWIYPNWDLPRLKKGFEDSRVFYDKVSTLVQKISGDILSEDMSLLVANGKSIYYEPFPMGQMSYSGVWDQSLILKELDQQHFAMAILYFYAPVLKRNRTFTVEFLQKFNERYRFVGRAEPPKNAAGLANNPLFLYAPRKET